MSECGVPMPTRAEMIAALKEQDAVVPPSREEMIAALKKQDSPEISKRESALRGAVQGGTLGFADEISGGAEALWNKAKGDPKAFGELYKQFRDESRSNFEAAERANPGTYKSAEIGTAIGTAFVPGMALARGAKLAKVAGQAAALGGAAGAGYSTADTAGGVAADAGMGAAVGGAIGGVAHVGAPYVGKAITGAAKKLKGFAEKTAVNATGATGKQAAEFADDAGRQLLDRGIVRFGDSQAKISGRAAKATKEAYKQIDDALNKLESNGVKVDANDIYVEMRKAIDKMKSDPSKADITKILESELDNLINATQAKGTAKFGVQEAEAVKRGYNRKAGNWADPEKSMAGKEAYQVWRSGVENAAKNADPATAKLFEEGKKTYGLLRPIEEAAERRAATTAQSPPGGFLDVTAGLAGGASGGAPLAIAAPVARRIIAPRLSSAAAVAADKAAKAIGGTAKAARGAAKFAAPVERAVNKSSRPKLPKNIPDAGENEEKPKPAPKGQEKWADDGAKKLLQSGMSKEQVEKLRSTPAGKKSLISASDLTPGSKAWKALVERIGS
jgi:hypothetical protein